MKSEINSVCLSRTRFVIRGHFRQYILFAGLQLSIPRAIDISSIVCRRSFSVYRLSSIIYLSVNLYSSLTVDGCCLLAPHLSGAAVGRRNFAAAVCRHPSPCSVAGTGLLVTTWRRLSPVFVIIDEGCNCCHASTSWTSVLSSLCYWFDQCS